MNQANVGKLVSRLNFKIQSKARRMSNPQGPEGRIRKMQKTVTALLKYERIELFYHRGDEARGYAERLISEAIRHGPQSKDMMDLANFYILEKQLVHKLFKVLVPRYQDYTGAYTKMHVAPLVFPGGDWQRVILELKGNPFPSIEQSNPHERMLLHNVLLDQARREFRMEKYQDLANSLKTSNGINIQ